MIAMRRCWLLRGVRLIGSKAPSSPALFGLFRTWNLVIGNTSQRVGEPSLRIDIVELGSRDRRVRRRRPLAVAIGTGEEPVFAADGNDRGRPKPATQTYRAGRRYGDGNSALPSAVSTDCCATRPASPAGHRSRWKPRRAWWRWPAPSRRTKQLTGSAGRWPKPSASRWSRCNASGRRTNCSRTGYAPSSAHAIPALPTSSLAEHNANPKPFVWTKSAEVILDKLDRCPVPCV